MQFLIHILLHQHKAGVRVEDAVGFGGGQSRPCCRRLQRKADAEREQHRAERGDVVFHLVYSCF